MSGGWGVPTFVPQPPPGFLNFKKEKIKFLINPVVCRIFFGLQIGQGVVNKLSTWSESCLKMVKLNLIFRKDIL